MNDYNKVNTALNTQQVQSPAPGRPTYYLGDAVYRLLTAKWDAYGWFASTKWDNNGPAPTPEQALSLEAIHNEVHVRVN
jgi:hypothetical protein